MAKKQYYLHFGSSLLEFKIYGALPPFLVFNYITFAMDCAAIANTAAGYDCGRASRKKSRSLQDLGDKLAIAHRALGVIDGLRPKPLRNALHEKGCLCFDHHVSEARAKR